MKKILFVCSHINSGSDYLFKSLDKNPKIQGYYDSANYSDANNLMQLTEQQHKLDNRSAIYMDHLLYNYQLSTKIAYQKCKFIYVIREPVSTISGIFAKQKGKPEFIIRHYLYRLRRICEMARNTPGAILLTYQNLIANQGLDLIEDYLNLKQKLELSIFEKNNNDILGYKIAAELNEKYERYLYYLKNQELKFV